MLIKEILQIKGNLLNAMKKSVFGQKIMEHPKNLYQHIKQKKKLIMKLKDSLLKRTHGH
jgi:hypothetical protein